MAAIDLTAIELENASQAETYEVAFVAGHSVGDIVRPSGAITTGATQTVGGIVVRAGDAFGGLTLVLRYGVVRGIAGAGAVANNRIFHSAANAADSTEPTPGAGGKAIVLGDMVTATRALIDIDTYEVEA